MEKGIHGFRLTALMVFMSVFVFSAAAFTKNTPVIELVDVDLSSKIIVIYGQNFVINPKATVIDLPDVTLGGAPLFVTSYSDERIDALLPAGITDGSYLLKVQMRTAGKDMNGMVATFDMTIGTTGPQGPQGPQGEQGPKGDIRVTQGRPGLRDRRQPVPIEANPRTSMCLTGRLIKRRHSRVQKDLHCTITTSSARH